MGSPVHASQGTSESGTSMSRKERGAIAAQACETCRNRKQKCSEGRPKCSSCEKLQTPCVYRSPPVTKKDRTLIQILETLKSVETKIDGLAAKGSTATTYPTTATILDDLDMGSLTASSTSEASPAHGSSGSSYHYVSSVAQMMEWPAIHQLIESHEVASTMGGMNLRRGLEIMAAKRPSLDRGQSLGGVVLGESTSVALPYPDVQPELDSGAAAIRWDAMQRLSKAYFDTYNFFHPLLDRDDFASTLSAVVSRGFGDDVSSVLVLMVLALGEASLAKMGGMPVLMDKGHHPPGLGGSSFEQPPGLGYFNEARKRMGFVLADIGLANIQVLCLAALWWDSCGRPMECSRLAANAALACQCLITSKPEELDGHQANLIRHNFWHCSIMGLSLHMEFDVPLLTSLDKLNEFVGLPDLVSPIASTHYAGVQAAPIQGQMPSEILLHRLCAGLHSTLMSTFTSGTPSFPGAGTSSPGTGEVQQHSVCKQLETQLNQWRTMLPEHLQWQDDQSLLYTDSNAFTLFAVGMGSQATGYPYAADMQVALFRTRFYYNKYLIYRPFVFKVLHYPALVTGEDAQAVAKCLMAGIKWPIAMPPLSLSKRLVPLALFWTQNLFGVLVLLHLSQQHPVLADIRASFCGPHFDFEANETLKLYIDWLRDMRKTGAVAERYWIVVQKLFALEM